MFDTRVTHVAAAARSLAAAACCVVTLCASMAPRTAGGQSAPVRADSARRNASPPTDNGLARGVSQSISISATSRSYKVGDVRVNEQVAPFSWKLTAPRVVLRASGVPLQLDAPVDQLNAWTPFKARADFVLRVGDTLSVYGRTGSSPVTLDSLAVRAVSAVGTSVLDLSSQSLGVPAQGGVRALFSFPMSDVVIGLSGALEHEARPNGAGATYWQGNTARGAITMRGQAGERELSATLDVSVSKADSLNGRNQFPGGGTLGLSASAVGPLDADARFFGVADAFFARPFGNDRPDQPTRLIPQGNLMGTSFTVLMQTGDVTWSPSVTLMRESSSASVTVLSGTQRSLSTLSGSAWSVAGGLSVDISLGHYFTLSPEIGAVGGSVSSSLAQTSGRVIGRRGRIVGATTVDSFSDPVTGFWGGIGVRFRR